MLRLAGFLAPPLLPSLVISISLGDGPLLVRAHFDAVWGDGKPITTKDVLFTWRMGRQGQTGILPIEFYRSAYKVEAKDDKTFTIHFDKLTFDYNAINSFDLVPAHVDQVERHAQPRGGGFGEVDLLAVALTIVKRDKPGEVMLSGGDMRKRHGIESA